MAEQRKIAYLSMEIGLEEDVPTYSGGLGILAGDTLRSAADLEIPLLAVSLLHRKGYFFQRLDDQGRQTEEPVHWPINDFVEELPERASIALEGRTVRLRAWRYQVTGITGFAIPVYLLDADLPENAPGDRRLTDFLYGGDSVYRISQEAILGIGGVRMLRALGYNAIEKFHMNEGHSSFLTLELLEERLRQAGRAEVTEEDLDAVRRMCVFTTHTPVPSGHDKFPPELVLRLIGKESVLKRQDIFCIDGQVNMTHIGLNLSHFINGVAKRHTEVSRSLFPNYDISSITNGVHAATWVARPMAELFDHHIPGWRQDNFSLRYAMSIPRQEIWNAHLAAKRELVHFVNQETNAGMDADVMTLGFARRITAYKRPALIFWSIDRLKRIAAEIGPFQIVYAGKAHPRDQHGKELIEFIYQSKAKLADDVRIAYLGNYGIGTGRLLAAGVDLWLNTPKPPLEASGTSGMKAAVNGVPSLSILDGWWIEGCIEGVTGWSIGDGQRAIESGEQRARDAFSFYDQLEKVVLPMFYKDRWGYINIMRQAIALNGSFFNTQRMMQEYALKAYFR